jgi:hypothetical protein
MLNFFARSGPKIEKIDSLWTGRGIGNGLGDGIKKLMNSRNDEHFFVTCKN